MLTTLCVQRNRGWELHILLGVLSYQLLFVRHVMFTSTRDFSHFGEAIQGQSMRASR